MTDTLAEADAGTATTELTALDRIVQEGRMARDDVQKIYARDLVGEFAAQVLDEGMSVGSDTVAAIVARIAQIDALISSQLNEIMHAPEFQELEASWRGLAYLVFNTETGTQLKLRLLNATQKELQDDLEKAVEFDQSNLFKKVYEEEYGTFGGHPFCLPGGRLRVRAPPAGHGAAGEALQRGRRRARAVRGRRLRRACSTSDSFTELGTPRDLAKIFESAELAKWRSFRDSEDSRYVALALPHILMRLPYGPDTGPVDGVNYVEDVDRARPLQVPVGERGLRAGAAHHRTPSRCTAGAPRSAAWRAAAWWRGCRRTPSRPTRATSRSSAPPRWRSPTGARRS